MEKIGLTTKEAEKRLERDGENRLAEKKKNSAVKLFAGQFKDTMVLILLVGAVISVTMGEIFDALTIIVIVLLNAILGFIQEYRTEKTLEALKQMAAPTADTYRDGKLTNIPAEKLVRGDVVRLEAGCRIPADCKIIECMAFECDESILTGESVPVSKRVGENHGNDLNQSTVCYMGTAVTKGHSIAEIIETGKETQMGKVSGLLSDIEEERTPLQKKLGELGKVIGIACIAICIVVSLAGILRGYAVFDMLLTGLSLAVAAIPEGLPATVTISLALAVRRIYRQNAIVNKLHSVETLGCTNVICTDKTGTLTQNKMTVTEIFVNDNHTSEFNKNSDQTLERLLLCGKLCNNSTESNGKYIGDPTETALMVAADKGNVRVKPHKRINEVPFDSSTRFMSVQIDEQGRITDYLKGSLDVVLAQCKYIEISGERKPLNMSERKKVTAAGDNMTAKALRTLGFAYKPRDCDGYIFLGIEGMSDPLRKEVRGAVAKCNKAGIRVIMLTGDHINTASEIAKQAGILKKNTNVLSGSDISKFSDEKLSECVKTTSVFARVSPTDKLRIVRALKGNGDVVAMTGDGVNDAPAVKEAAIGVSMGITGTDVTKEAAKIVLLDDNFATLVSAVEQGRTIYDNIRKFVRYMISCNIGEVLTMLVAMILGFPVVLLPIQILLINLVTDGLPAIALGMEPPTEGIMEMKPRGANESIFSGGFVAKILMRGVSIAFFTLLTFVLTLDSSGLDAARTAAFATLGLSQLVFVFECKDDSKGLFATNYGNNVKLILAVLISALIIFVLMCSNLFSGVFNTTALDLNNILVVALCSAGLPLIKSFFKLFFK